MQQAAWGRAGIESEKTRLTSSTEEKAFDAGEIKT
jgi:hypothetical protein